MIRTLFTAFFFLPLFMFGQDDGPALLWEISKENSKKKSYSWLFNESFSYFPLPTAKPKDKVFTITDLETKESFDVSQYIKNVKTISLPDGNPGKWVAVRDMSDKKYIINPKLKRYVPLSEYSSSYQIEFIEDYEILVLGTGVNSEAYKTEGIKYNPLENVNKFLREPSTCLLYTSDAADD